MRKFVNWCRSIFAQILSYGSRGKIAKANGIEIWYETFGKKKDPAILLIMGARAQCIFWPEELCEKVAKEGFYVIRYDNRDVGLSSHVDFQKEPYSLVDMAKDAAGLLDWIGIKRAHLVGVSMGGPIAEFVALHFPEKVLTLTLLATSCDFTPGIRALEGLPPEEGALSPPKSEYISWVQNHLQTPTLNPVEIIERHTTNWRLLSGSVFPFEEDLYRSLSENAFFRDPSTDALINHSMAIRLSCDLIRSVPKEIKIPTLILHGSEDPIFPPDHGHALARLIENSEYIGIDGMGHVPMSSCYEVLVSSIKQHTKRHH